ncbi:MAG: hypothetical protein LH616_13575, partial [Ilumatobacteraceae bacterium]|nr:hypothetical protein [Ilumatobacteraceae bacterium]
NAGSAQFLAEQAYRRQMNSLLRNSSVFGWGGVFGAWFDDPQFYGLNPYGNGFLNPFGFQNFGGFNNGLGGGWVNGNTPYVIVPNNPQPSPSNSGPGRVINGLGYTAERPGDSDGGATPRPNIGSDGGGSRGSSGASSGGGSASSGEGERTAKPRPQL